jgi:tmRNA-binding protein
VVPVRSFLRSPEPTALGTRTIDGHEAIGVEVSASQVAPLLDGLRPAGNLRQFFPSDVVSLWLDAASWTPLRFEVRVSDDPDRVTWAINRGYVDHDPRRKRRLLLHKYEIRKLIGKTVEKGLTLVPTKMYFKNGKIKVAIGLARGKQDHDKRETLRRREADRETRAAVKERVRK